MMPKPKEKCPVGHTMNTENTYWQRKHGNTYSVCRTCKRLASKKRQKFQYTRSEQLRIARSPVVHEDTTGLEKCPKCTGPLYLGAGNEYEDALSCVYCGWRPSATVEVEL